MLGLDRERVVQEPRGDLPQALHAVGAGEQRLVTEHSVEDEPLITLEAVGRAELVLLAECHLRGAEAHLGRWLPGQEVGCDGNCGARLRLAWAACRDHRRVIFSAVHVLVRGLLCCLLVLARREVSRDAELLMLRHGAQGCAARSAGVRYQPGARL